MEIKMERIEIIGQQWGNNKCSRQGENQRRRNYYCPKLIDTKNQTPLSEKHKT